ncbi:MAG: hypothetical protein M3R17_07785, partial [Bacteroidota bacterium]|nr:hypothetical protein [Bacteroidota bacterium]
MVSDKIDMNFRVHNLNHDQIIVITKGIMEILNKQSFLPVPDIIDQSDKKEVKISGYMDSQIMRIAEDELQKRHLVFLLLKTDSDFSIGILPHTDFSCTIGIPFDSESTITADQLKYLFISLCKFLNPDIALCYAWNAFSHIKREYFEWEQRTPYFHFFKWLQYFGPKEFRLQGGEAIFQNPYIKAEKMGEGVFIQVGESPLDAHTPEGE